MAMDSWIGHHKSELILKWGPPDRYESDGKGGEIIVYEKTSNSGNYVYNQYVVTNNSNFTMMYADSLGLIYYWRTGSK